eukprot:TRINITY_DN1678_c0_g3_i2.p1 TRINITY_DN1678_c0_g3~~TRINITY_DN1678_c0_g3_i2.p1  ORF type:complete len:1396 (+),score=522.46 TRINITY_DN1678_c0_g3_i2:71-4189(+)
MEPAADPEAGRQNVYRHVSDAHRRILKEVDAVITDARRLKGWCGGCWKLQTTLFAAVRDDVDRCLQELLAKIPRDQEVEDFKFLPSDDVLALQHYTSDLKANMAEYREKLRKSEEAYRELFARLDSKDKVIDDIRDKLWRDLCQAHVKLSAQGRGGGNSGDSGVAAVDLFDGLAAMEVRQQELCLQHRSMLQAREQEWRRARQQIEDRFRALLRIKDKELLSKQLEYRNLTWRLQSDHRSQLEDLQAENQRLQSEAERIREVVEQELEVTFAQQRDAAVADCRSQLDQEIGNLNTELAACRERATELEESNGRLLEECAQLSEEQRTAALREQRLQQHLHIEYQSFIADCRTELLREVADAEQRAAEAEGQAAELQERQRELEEQCAQLDSALQSAQAEARAQWAARCSALETAAAEAAGELLSAAESARRDRAEAAADRASWQEEAERMEAAVAAAQHAARSMRAAQLRSEAERMEQQQALAAAQRQVSELAADGEELREVGDEARRLRSELARQSESRRASQFALDEATALARAAEEESRSKLAEMHRRYTELEGELAAERRRSVVTEQMLEGARRLSEDAGADRQLSGSKASDGRRGSTRSARSASPSAVEAAAETPLLLLEEMAAIRARARGGAPPAPVSPERSPLCPQHAAHSPHRPPACPRCGYLPGGAGVSPSAAPLASPQPKALSAGTAAAAASPGSADGDDSDGAEELTCVLTVHRQLRRRLRKLRNEAGTEAPPLPSVLQLGQRVQARRSNADPWSWACVRRAPPGGPVMVRFEVGDGGPAQREVAASPSDGVTQRVGAVSAVSAGNLVTLPLHRLRVLDDAASITFPEDEDTPDGFVDLLRHNRRLRGEIRRLLNLILSGSDSEGDDAVAEGLFDGGDDGLAVERALHGAGQRRRSKLGRALRRAESPERVGAVSRVAHDAWRARGRELDHTSVWKRVTERGQLLDEKLAFLRDRAAAQRRQEIAAVNPQWMSEAGDTRSPTPASRPGSRLALRQKGSIRDDRAREDWDRRLLGMAAEYDRLCASHCVAVGGGFVHAVADDAERRVRARPRSALGGESVASTHTVVVRPRSAASERPPPRRSQYAYEEYCKRIATLRLEPKPEDSTTQGSASDTGGDIPRADVDVDIDPSDQEQEGGASPAAPPRPATAMGTVSQSDAECAALERARAATPGPGRTPRTCSSGRRRPRVPEPPQRRAAGAAGTMRKVARGARATPAPCMPMVPPAQTEDPNAATIDLSAFRTRAVPPVATTAIAGPEQLTAFARHIISRRSQQPAPEAGGEAPASPSAGGSARVVVVPVSTPAPAGLQQSSESVDTAGTPQRPAPPPQPAPAAAAQRRQSGTARVVKGARRKPHGDPATAR